MHLVEQHVIPQTDQRFATIDRAAFAAKNLYNAALYLVRQSFIFERIYLNYYDINARMKDTAEYHALPRKASQQVLKLLHHNWQGFFGAMKAYKADPSKFLGRPKLPKYLDKQNGRFILIYTLQAISVPALKRGMIVLSRLAIEVQTRQTAIVQVRIVPRGAFYVVEVVYERDIQPAP